MAFSDYARAVLAGGLPAVLDVGSQGGTRQGDTRPERTAPSSTVADDEPFTSRLSQGLTLETGVLALVGVAALVGIIYFVARR